MFASRAFFLRVLSPPTPSKLIFEPLNSIVFDAIPSDSLILIPPPPVPLKLSVPAFDLIVLLSKTIPVLSLPPIPPIPV